MYLNDVISACGARISGGDPYQWNCYGGNAQYLEFRDIDNNGYSHCIFDTKIYTVFEIHLEIPGTDKCFRWLNPQTKQSYLVEAKRRNTNPNEAWDGVEYTEIDDEETFLLYLKEIGEKNYHRFQNDDSFTVPMPGTIGGAKLVFPEEDTTKMFTVNLDVRYVLEVKADSMDEAVEKARHFQETMPKGWGDHSDFDICWIDTYVVKESAEREVNI